MEHWRELPYERNLSFNAINRFLHGGRYKTALKWMQRVREPDSPLKVLDIGCATAMLYPKLTFPAEYTGLDIRTDFIEAANERHGGNRNFRALLTDIETAIPTLGQQDVICALETFEHIPSDALGRILPKLLELNPKLLIATVPIEVGPAIWFKNVGSFLMGYPRWREYRWSETFWAGLYHLDYLPPHTVHHKGFDWRKLRYQIGRHFKIIEVVPSPVPFESVAPSVAIIAKTERLSLPQAEAEAAQSPGERSPAVAAPAAAAAAPAAQTAALDWAVQARSAKQRD